MTQLTEDGVAILETRQASPSHFLMRVESVSLLSKNGIHKYESREFHAGRCNWRLILSPNEDKNGIDNKYISVYLAISHKNADTYREVNAIFSIFLLNQISGNYHYSSGGIHQFHAMKPEWGISKFISKEIMMDPSKGFLIDDNCVFGAEVFVLEKPAVSERISLKNVSVPYKREWKISNFSKLGKEWTSEKFVVEGVNWVVKMYPKGEIKEKGRCQAMGIFIGLIDSKRVKACFSICIKDQINNQHKKLTADSHWFSPSSTWGWPRFMELPILKDSKNGFIVKGCCHLKIEISVQAVSLDSYHL